MGQGGCPIDLGNPGLRQDPRITVIQNIPGSLTVTLSVDLNLYPETIRINWEFGDGSSLINMTRDTGRIVTHDFVRSGEFTVRAYLFNTRGLVAIGELTIDVVGPNANPIAQFINNDISDGMGGFLPRAVRFDAAQSSDPDGSVVMYEWDFGDGLTGTGVTIDHAYATSGRFNVRLTVTDNRGGTGMTQRLVAANTRPTADFDFTPNGPEAPQLLTVAFDGSPSMDTDGTIDTYSWNFGDGGTATGMNVQHVYANPGEYSVTLTVTDNLGGLASSTQDLDLRGTLPFILSITPVNGVVNTTVNITDLAGLNFAVGAAVRMTRTGQTDITASNVNVVSDTQITCSFNLANAALGDWNVVVRNPGGAEATRNAAFRVVTANRVRLNTSLGDIVLELDPQRAPNHVANFLRYVDEERYDGIVFHRVPQPDFVIQAGAFRSLGFGNSPRLEEVAGLPAINSEANNGLSNIRGTIALALRGQNANSGSSQWFINVIDNPNLDNGPPPFTVFGRVVQGLDVVDLISDVQTSSFLVRLLDGSTTTFQDVPVQDVTILSARRE